MKKYILFIVVLLFSWNYSKSQCVDSSRIDTYFPCFDGFDPVCGCDGNNYRSQCAAYHWGGINYYVQGTCDNFEFDFVPNPIVDYPGQFSVFVKNPSSILFQIFDMRGTIRYTYSYYTTNSNQKIGPINVSFSGFPIGLYCIVVTVAGEQKSKKILRVIQ